MGYIHTHEPDIEPPNEPEKFVCGSQYFNRDFNEASQDISFYGHTFDLLPELKNTGERLKKLLKLVVVQPGKGRGN